MSTCEVWKCRDYISLGLVSLTVTSLTLDCPFGSVLLKLTYTGQLQPVLKQRYS